jgi:hypothetical protein
MNILEQIKYQPARVAGGYTDWILRVDLAARKISIQELPPDFKQTSGTAPREKPVMTVLTIFS